MERPDFNKIKAETLNPKSSRYYPTLIKKYMSADTSMTIEDYRYLYYGYAFQEDYNPYRASEYAKRIKPLYFKEKHTNAECDTIMKYAELSLEDNPFDLQQMTFFIIALKEKRKNARAAIWQYRLNHLVAAIVSSGNGTKDNPWVVTSTAHEYNILNFWNLVAIGHETEGENLDVLKVKPRKETDPDTYYFDVTLVIDAYITKISDSPRYPPPASLRRPKAELCPPRCSRIAPVTGERQRATPSAPRSPSTPHSITHMRCKAAHRTTQGCSRSAANLPITWHLRSCARIGKG